MALNALLGKHNDKRATRQHVHRTIDEGIDGL
jgi:hypothetical protein